MEGKSQQVTSAPASYVRRAAAVLVDGGVTLGAAISVYAGLEPHDISTLQRGDGFLVLIPLNWALIGAAYSTILHGSGRGQTFGKILLAIRVGDATTGGGIGLRRAFRRWVVTAVLWGFPVSVAFPVAAIGGVLDAIWPLFDSRRQALHDKAAGTVVYQAERARLPRMSIRIGGDALGRPLSVGLATAAALVGLIFALAAEGLNPVWRLLLFLGVALACIDAATGRSLRTPTAGNRRPLLARLREEFVTDVVAEIGRTERIGATDLRTRILSAAADGRLALFALFAGILALYGHSALLSADKVEGYRLALAFLGLSFLAPLPGSMLAVAVKLRERASATATAACVGSVLVLALSAQVVSLPMFTIGIVLAALAARATRSALPLHPTTMTPTATPVA